MLVVTNHCQIRPNKKCQSKISPWAKSLSQIGPNNKSSLFLLYMTNQTKLMLQ